MVRESRLRAKKRFERKYFQASEIIFQLSDTERIIIDQKYGMGWMQPAMDLDFEITDYKERVDLRKGVYECPVERYVPKYDKSLMYFEQKRNINQYYRKIFRLLLEKII